MEMTDKSPTVSNHETKPNHDGDALSPHDSAPGSGEFKNVRAISPPRTLVNLPTIVPPKRDLIVELGQRWNWISGVTLVITVKGRLIPFTVIGSSHISQWNGKFDQTTM